MAKLRVLYFPDCELREEAVKLGREISKELSLDFEHGEKSYGDGGVSPAFYLNETELFPAKVSGAVCRSKIPSKDDFIRELKSLLEKSTG